MQLEHGDGTTPASSALPRTNPDGDFWWVYTRPAGASGNDVLDAYLRITGQDTDTVLEAEFLKLDIDTDGISLWRDGTGGQLAATSVPTADDTPYLIHAHVFREQVVIRRGRLGQPLTTVLRIDTAPVQGTDRFVLEAGNACLVDDVNIGEGVSEYTYDALGRRIEKRAGGDTTRFLYDGARVAEEWDMPDTGSPTLSARYVYGLYIDEVLTMRRGGTDYYYHGDDQHNVVKLTDSNGDVLEAYDYADYGQPEFYSPPANPGQPSGARLDITESAFGNPYLFTGRRWDAELGYYYFRNRYLDPAHGRFASRDPLGLWGDEANLGNGYTYAANNPWSRVDPFGLASGGNAVGEWLDRTQLALGAAGMAPGVGIVPDAVSLLISLGRLDIQGAAIDGLAMIPGVGQGVRGGDLALRLSREAVEHSDEVADAVRAGDKLTDTAKVGDEFTDTERTYEIGELMPDGRRAGYGPGTPARGQGPDPVTGSGYGVNDPPVRIEGEWSDADLTRALYGRPPRGLGSPDLHQADQMPGSGVHEIVPSQHRTNTVLHQNRYNQGVTPVMRESDRQLHWWYRAREQGADQRMPDLIYDD